MQLTHVWTHLVRISKIPTLVHVGRLCKTTCMPQIYIYIYTWLKEHGNVTVPKIGQANANNSCVKASTFWGFEVLYNILKIQISFWGNVSYKMILRKILLGLCADIWVKSPLISIYIYYVYCFLWSCFPVQIYGSSKSCIVPLISPDSHSLGNQAEDGQLLINSVFLKASGRSKNLMIRRSKCSKQFRFTP